MSYPGNAEYAQAVRDYPHISILDPKLKSGIAKRGRNNQIVSYSGGFSIVFPIEVTSKTYALRGWLKDVGDAETRYQAISDYLTRAALPYFVDFEYVSEGILVNGNKWPITRMEWAEGETVCQFIEDNLHDAGLLRTAAAEFLKMVEALHGHEISHGDLQDGNILLKRNGPDVAVKLIDYDSVFVPSLQGYPDNIVGLPEYQHPQRIAGGGTANARLDYFSELVIYLSLLSLAEKPGLWSQFGQRTERALLFVEADFKNATQSDVLQELENLSSDVKLLASKLKDFCAKTSIDQLEPLEVLLPRTDPAAKKACNQGLIFLHSQRYNEAIAEFEKAIRIESNFREAHHGLGLTYLQIGNLDLAKRKAEDTLKIDANYWPALQLLDTVRQMLRNIKPNQPASKPSGTPSSSQSASSKNSTIRRIFGACMALFHRRRRYFYPGIISVCVVIIILLIITRPPDDGKQNQGKLPADTSPQETGPDSKIPVLPIPSEPAPPLTPVVSVSVNAVPWAEVFIKLPGTDRFIKPPEKKSNITPIRGGLKVPIGTEIKLVYEGIDKVFPYEKWRRKKSISHDFLKP